MRFSSGLFRATLGTGFMFVVLAHSFAQEAVSPSSESKAVDASASATLPDAPQPLSDTALVQPLDWRDSTIQAGAAPANPTAQSSSQQSADRPAAAPASLLLPSPAIACRGWRARRQQCWWSPPTRVASLFHLRQLHLCHCCRCTVPFSFFSSVAMQQNGSSKTWCSFFSASSSQQNSPSKQQEHQRVMGA